MAAAWRFAQHLAAIGLSATLNCAGASAQQTPGAPFLFLNQERILTGSDTGKRLLAEEEAARDELRAQARAIDKSFEDEEQALTDLRPKLPPEEFRTKADDFDQRVVQARHDQDARSDALVQEFDQRRRQFYAGVAPILVRLMARFGAKAIFDENSVLLADQALNITEVVITEIDAARAPEAGSRDAPKAPDGSGPATGSE